MKCRETHFWLYTLRPNSSWPVEVVNHLQGCRDCQQLQARLKAIDAEMLQLTCAPAKSSAKANLLAKLEKTPQVAAPTRPTLTRPAPIKLPIAIRIAGVLTAAAALLLIGWLIGHHRDVVEPLPREIVRTVEVIREKPIEVIRERFIPVESPQSERSLFAALLKGNARLVQASQPRERLESLLNMAADCRQHALGLIENGPREALPFTIDLYKQILQEGIAPQVQQAPAEARPHLRATVRDRLEKLADLPAHDGKPLPKAAQDQRDAMRNAAREAMELVDQPVQIAGTTRTAPTGPVAPAAALVQFAIAYSTETEPVAKADTCSDCVARLTPFLMLCLADEAMPERGEIGQHFGAMIQHGVYSPLASAGFTELAAEKAERINQSTGEAVLQMKQNVDATPGAGKVGLERMLDATKKGFEKSKGKGPPWLRDPFEHAKPKGKSANPKSPKKACANPEDLPVPVPPRVIAFVSSSQAHPSHVKRIHFGEMNAIHSALADGERLT